MFVYLSCDSFWACVQILVHLGHVDMNLRLITNKYINLLFLFLFNWMFMMK